MYCKSIENARLLAPCKNIVEDVRVSHHTPTACYSVVETPEPMKRPTPYDGNHEAVYVFFGNGYLVRESVTMPGR